MLIDRPDQFGNRPIHVALDFVERKGVDTEVLSPLLASGVHTDAVDHSGFSCLDLHLQEMREKALLRSDGPLPLSCLCAKAIVAQQLPYQREGLPAHVVKSIKLHNFRHAPVTENLNIV